MTSRRKTTRRQFGKLERLPSGRFRARYTHPDDHARGVGKFAHKAPHTFANRSGAEAWLAAEQRLIDLEAWTPIEERQAKEQARATTLAEWVDVWLDGANYKPSTKDSHRRRLDLRVLYESRPGFDSLADERVADLTPDRMARWWRQVGETWPDTANTNAMAYRRLSTCLKAAVNAGLIESTPLAIPGAAKAPRPESRDRDVLTPEQVRAIHDGMTDRYRVIVSLMAYAGLRFGEALELRRKDLHGLDGGGPVVVRVRRNVQRVKRDGKQVMIALETPKTDAGVRDVPLPSKVAAEVRAHCAEHVAEGPEALLFMTTMGRRPMDTSVRTLFDRAAKAAGRPDVTPHDCRRFYGTRLVASRAVTLEEARRLMGHETVEQLMEYQRVADGFGERAAAALNNLV